jgi:DNA-binding MarR family transcriptional regulator
VDVVQTVDVGSRRELIGRITDDYTAITEAVAGARLETLIRLPLTLGQLKVLLRLVATGGTTTNGLAAHLGVSTAAVSPVVDKLVERGLVVREQDTEDRRVKNLAASTAGADLVSAVFDEGGWARGGVLGAVSSEGLEALATGLSAVREAVARLASGKADDD